MTMTRPSSIATTLLLLSLLLLHLPLPCDSFSASSVNLRNNHQNIFVRLLRNSDKLLKTSDFPIFRQDDNTKNNLININTTASVDATTSNSIEEFSANRWWRRQVEFPSLPEFPSSLIQTSHEQYLQRHLIVKKRRVVKRMLEITTILGGQILRPLLCALVQTQPDVTKILSPSPKAADDEWDLFWRQKRNGLTNAQRVAKGVPALGPTFVKTAQILATRPDILHVPLAQALGELQDKGAPPFDNLTAKRIVRTELKRKLRMANYESLFIQNQNDLQTFMDSLSNKPRAAATVAQVYKGELPGYGPVAVKVLRPGIRAKVERDATLFHSIATWIEYWNNQTMSVPLLSRINIGSLQLVAAVDEFTSRVLEDMDFTREAENMKVFSQLYDSQRGISPTVKVVVPQVIPELCSDRILVMEWLEGTKLTDICVDCEARPQQVQENLQLIVQAIEITISQLIDHGLLHGDPHSANLLKVQGRTSGKPELGYLDFGLVSYVPQKFRDGIVCAVVQLVFARNIRAVADLCEDLGLLPEHTLQDPQERQRFLQALKDTLDQILIWPKDSKGLHTEVPKVRFEHLLPAVSKLIRSFEFTVPPYFLNNIRALATLEGMALQLDPNFNVLRVIYPYSINRLMRNPSVSRRVQETFVEICRSPETKLISPRRVHMLLNDWALWTGYRKRKVFWDLVCSAGGRRVAPVIIHNWYLNRVRQSRNVLRHCRQLFVHGYEKIKHVVNVLLGRTRQRQPAVY